MGESEFALGRTTEPSTLGSDSTQSEKLRGGKMSTDEFARRDLLTAAAAVATVAVAAPAYASGHADPGHQHILR